MRAIVHDAPGHPLRLEERDVPESAAGQVLVRVRACGVCRTDLHLVDGELPQATPPVVPGHQIVGDVVRLGTGVLDLAEGARVGIPWLGWSCGTCAYCTRGRENLCPAARFTGCQIDGGFAEFAVADARYCFPLPEGYADTAAAPLLCAGLIGYRALRMAGDARRIGLYGFGASAHVLAQIIRHRGDEFVAITRPGDAAAQRFARELGAAWAGGADETPPPFDAAIIFAPVGALVPAALRAVVPGGRVVCAGIHMSDVPSFPYADLWMERSIQSVANLTRRDGDELLALAPRVPVRTEVHVYDLADAQRALDDLRAGRFTGAAVLVP